MQRHCPHPAWGAACARIELDGSARFAAVQGKQAEPDGLRRSIGCARGQLVLPAALPAQGLGRQPDAQRAVEQIDMASATGAVAGLQLTAQLADKKFCRHVTAAPNPDARDRRAGGLAQLLVKQLDPIVVRQALAQLIAGWRRQGLGEQFALLIFGQRQLFLL